MEEIQDAIEEIGEIELKWGICIEKDEILPMTLPFV